jgi:hypothetical protein
VDEQEVRMDEREVRGKVGGGEEGEQRGHTSRTLRLAGHAKGDYYSFQNQRFLSDFGCARHFVCAPQSSDFTLIYLY